MIRLRMDRSLVCGVCLVGMSCLIPIAAHGGGEKAAGGPKGSEKAVAAVRAAFPSAEGVVAVEPKGFGGSGGRGTPLYWSVRFQQGGKKRELSVTPEGVIMRMPMPVAVKELPKPVADAVAKAAPDETVTSAEKNEMRATLKYVALAKSHVQRYAVLVKQDGKTTRYVVGPDGKNARAVPARRQRKRRSRPRSSPSPPRLPRRSRR